MYLVALSHQSASQSMSRQHSTVTCPIDGTTVYVSAAMVIAWRFWRQAEQVRPMLSKPAHLRTYD